MHYITLRKTDPYRTPASDRSRPAWARSPGLRLNWASAKRPNMPTCKETQLIKCSPARDQTSPSPEPGPTGSTRSAFRPDLALLGRVRFAATNTTASSVAARLGSAEGVPGLRGLAGRPRYVPARRDGGWGCGRGGISWDNRNGPPPPLLCSTMAEGTERTRRTNQTARRPEALLRRDASTGRDDARTNQRRPETKTRKLDLVQAFRRAGGMHHGTERSSAQPRLKPEPETSTINPGRAQQTREGRGRSSRELDDREAPARRGQNRAQEQGRGLPELRCLKAGAAVGRRTSVLDGTLPNEAFSLEDKCQFVSLP